MKPVRFLLDVPKHADVSDLQVTQGSAMQLPMRSARKPRLWTEYSDHLVDAGQHGVVVGYLFARATGKRITALPPDLTDTLDPVGLAIWLTRECWGAYAAILRKGPTLQIYCDPSGLLPVYRSETQEHLICTTDMTLVASAGRPKPHVSWAALALHIQRPESRGAQTCLDRVEELAPGHLTSLQTSARPTAQLWCPTQFMPDEPTTSFDALALELRRTAQCTVRAWGSLSARVLIAASGGVDSSLIAAALATTRQDFACLTVATVDPSGDESAPVRQLARHLDVEMYEARYAADRIDLREPVSVGLPRPNGKAFMHDVRRAAREAACAFATDTVFDGNGGDNIFCYLHSAAPILDRWRCEGVSRGTIATLVDMCRITQATIPAMLQAVVSRSRRAGMPAPWSADRRLLSGDVDDRQMPTFLDHLTMSLPDKHPGKVDHLGLLARTQNFIHPATGHGDPLQFSPLMSQPLVELCLSIPT